MNAPTTSNPIQLFALLQGTFSGGWEFIGVRIGKIAAQEAVVAAGASGLLTEAVAVKQPSALDARLTDASNLGGHHYVVLAECGIGAGLTIYGPFSDVEEARVVADAHRPEDGECYVKRDPEQSDLRVALHPARLTIDAHCMDDQFKATLLADYGVVVVDESQAPWAFVFEGPSIMLKKMVVAHWDDSIDVSQLDLIPIP